MIHTKGISCRSNRFGEIARQVNSGLVKNFSKEKKSPIHLKILSLMGYLPYMKPTKGIWFESNRFGEIARQVNSGLVKIFSNEKKIFNSSQNFITNGISPVHETHKRNLV